MDERVGDSGATHDASEDETSSIAGSVLGATLEASGKDACWSDFDLGIAVEEPMDEDFDWSVNDVNDGHSALVYLIRQGEAHLSINRGECEGRAPTGSQPRVRPVGRRLCNIEFGRR